MHTADSKSITRKVSNGASSSTLSSPSFFGTISSNSAKTARRGEKRKEQVSIDPSIDKLPAVSISSTKTDWNAQVKLILAGNTSKKKNV
jgi:hypothetical protein